MYNPYDYYFNQAKKKGYKARSAFKLDEIQQKFHLFDKNTKTILDIGCSPGSWIQYSVSTLQHFKVKSFKIVGFDIKNTEINLPGVQTYVQDVTETDKVFGLIEENKITDKSVDLIISDMAQNTIGMKSMDAIRLFVLLEQTIPIYQKYLKPGGKFAIKVFMGPGFEEFVASLKNLFGGKNIKVFKPNACRKESKETYIVKYR